ncbi:Protein EXUTER 1 [Ranunculus cassubicifolius]
MASVSAPTFPSHYKHHKSQFNSPKFLSLPSPPLNKKFPPLSHNKISKLGRLCRCLNSSSSSPLDSDNNNTNVERNWEFGDIVKKVISRIEDYLNSNKKSVELDVKDDDDDEEWDWERWKKHFQQVDEQEKIVSLFKSQVGNAVHKEEYAHASKLKIAMAAAATNDVVGRVITQLDRAVEEERYQDAAFLRDHAGAGLMGWWAGISEDSDDPYGRIIHIGVEHGRYVARSFSPRHLATSAPGVPVFEIFLTVGSKGEYNQQAVYLKRTGGKFDVSPNSSKSIDPSSLVSQLNQSNDVKDERSPKTTESTEDKDDGSDGSDGLAGVKNILRDMNPDAKITVLEVSAPGKEANDLILNVIEHILEDDEDEDNDEETDEELESVDTDDEDEDEVIAEGDYDIEIEVEDGDTESGNELSDMEIKVEDGDSSDNGNEISNMEIKVVIGGRLQKLSGGTDAKTLLRVPARLEKKSRLSFSFSVEEDAKQREVNKELASSVKSAKVQDQRSISNVMSELAKLAISREKIPTKVLKGVEDFITLTLNKAKNRQPLSGTTTFNRIEISPSSDLLNGLYVGAHGLYTSEVIHLTRKFGQWKDDKGSDLEFYEYVEALKLTGDPYVPAGQVAFRAKVGKQYQLPHKGLIPEEFGVVARYKGQGRLAEPGFKKPRWVDGELVILDGKYVKGGPVIGFVYWAPDYQFLVFFNRLRLPK